MISGISAVAVRLLQVSEDGETLIIAEPKGLARTAFYPNCFFKVDAGDGTDRFFYLCDSGAEIWGDTAEETLSKVNHHIRDLQH